MASCAMLERRRNANSALPCWAKRRTGRTKTKHWHALSGGYGLRYSRHEPLIARLVRGLRDPFGAFELRLLGRGVRRAEAFGETRCSHRGLRISTLRSRSTPFVPP